MLKADRETLRLILAANMLRQCGSILYLADAQDEEKTARSYAALYLLMSLVGKNIQPLKDSVIFNNATPFIGDSSKGAKRFDSEVVLSWADAFVEEIIFRNTETLIMNNPGKISSIVSNCFRKERDTKVFLTHIKSVDKVKRKLISPSTLHVQCVNYNRADRKQNDLVRESIYKKPEESTRANMVAIFQESEILVGIHPKDGEILLSSMKLFASIEGETSAQESGTVLVETGDFYDYLIEKTSR